MLPFPFRFLFEKLLMQIAFTTDCTWIAGWMGKRLVIGDNDYDGKTGAVEFFTSSRNGKLRKRRAFSRFKNFISFKFFSFALLRKTPKKLFLWG
jgi:hypothetical protein